MPSCTEAELKMSIKILLFGLLTLIFVGLGLSSKILADFNYLSLFFTGFFILVMLSVSSVYVRVTGAVLLAFFYLRNLQLVGFPERFIYDRVAISPESLAYTSVILSCFCFAIASGAIVGTLLSENKKNVVATNLLPFERFVTSPRMYIKIAILFYVGASLALVFLRLTSGAGMPGLNNYLAETAGYLVVSLRVLQPLSVSIIVFYLASKAEIGKQSKIFKFGITACFLAAVFSFSKAGLLYFMMPVILYYLVNNMPIPRKILRWGFYLFGFSVFIYGILMGAIRAQLSGSITGTEGNHTITFSEAISEGYLAFLDRLGSSFDVIHGILINIDQFRQQTADFGTQVAVSLNHFVPGEIIVTGGHTPLASILPMILRGYSTERIGGYGENVNTIGLLLSTVGVEVGLLIVFLVSLAGAVIFYWLKSTVARVFLLITLITGLSNGGEIGSYMEPLIFFLISHILILMIWAFSSLSSHSRARGMVVS